ncbi:hypothetical protein [Maribacter polysaccharolyticus]|uniref:hypothetical protein n=1 Tax=Maribacter polysaccharolyticus TaxID=3020831 RepID=UPI00237F4743|nr:hypothetical protein [Maribacter polysaccharolyticus]MDE3741071.1 hypothetical protein [Maribacter polysaccharolyticus]
MKKQLITGVLMTITLMSCKTDTKKMEVQKPIVETSVETNEEPSSGYKVGSQVPDDLVCMVNNAYMAKPQIPVLVNGKTYYGCCEMCVGTLNNNESARVGIDPFSKKPIDKTEAYIVLMKDEGDVAYFESEQNFLNYKETLNN